MFCEKCGHKNEEDSNFCDKCSFHMSESVAPTISAPIDQVTAPVKYNKKAIWIIVIVIVIMVFIGITIFSDSSNNSNSKTEQTSSSNTETWKEFNSVAGNFKILFPTFPTHETIPLNIEGINNPLNAEQYSSSQSDGTAYLVTFNNHSDEIDSSNPKANLENAVNGTLQHVDNGKLISSNFSKFGNHDAIDYLIFGQKDSLYFKGKSIMAGKILYGLLVAYEQKNISNIQTDKFFNSFQLTSNPAIQTNQNTPNQSDVVDPVTRADYQEGYKSGYVDGRSSKGQLGDNYAEPATEERKSAYFIGYLDGFLKGCREGNFDCSEVENAINSLGEDSSTNVNLIPPSVN